MVVFKMKIQSINIMYTIKIGQMELQAVINKTKFICFLFLRITLSSKNCIKGIELTYRGANIASTVVTAQPELPEQNSWTVTIRSVMKSKRDMYSRKYSMIKIRLHRRARPVFFLKVFERYTLIDWARPSEGFACSM